MKTKLRVRRPLHHGSLAARAPVVPLPRWRGGGKGRRARDASASKLDARRGANWRNSSPFVAFTLCFSLPSQKKKEAERRQTLSTNRRILRRGAHPAGRARLSAFHHGSHLREYSSQRLGFRPGFLGRGPHGRYPASPVPVQGCTSHPGHHAGRLIPKPPGSDVQSRPRAPHPLHLRLASGRRPARERDKMRCNCGGDQCQ
jgi:hypothetical protein